MTTKEEASTLTSPNVQDKHFFQYVVAFSATLAYFSTAQAAGWSSPSIPKLMANDSPIPISADDGSWLVVIPIVGVLITCYPAGWVMDKYGRKRTVLIGAAPLITGWIFIGLANSLGMLFAGRIFIGISYGFIYTVLPIYLGEIASDKIRGIITTWLIVMGKSGVVFVFSIGPYVTIRQMAWIGIVSPIIFVATFMWLPESPYYLLGKQRRPEAHRSLSRLRGHDDVDAELARMDEAVRKSQENRGTFRELLAKENRLSLIIIFMLAAMQYLCGNSAILDYSQTIFSKIESKLEASDISIILAVVSLVSVLIGNYFVDVAGRKPLLIISVTGTGICTATVGLYFFLERQSVDVSSIGWIPITALMLFEVSHGIGLAIVVFAMLAEMFPTNLKAVVASTFAIFAGLADVVVSKLFQTISDNWRSDVSFWIFAGFSFAFVPFIVFVIPETKGKPLNVILDELRYGKKAIDVKGLQDIAKNKPFYSPLNTKEPREETAIRPSS